MKIKMFFVFMISFILFSIDAKAATAFTCLYYNSDTTVQLSLAVMQESNGNIIVLENPTAYALSSTAGWVQSYKSINYNFYQRPTNQGNYAASGGENGYLQCPGSIEVTETQYILYSRRSVGTYNSLDNDRDGNADKVGGNTIKNYEQLTTNTDGNIFKQGCSKIATEDKWLENKEGNKCLYELSYGDWCHVFLLNIGEDASSTYLRDNEMDVWGGPGTDRIFSLDYEPQEFFDYVTKEKEGYCPTALYVSYNNGINSAYPVPTELSAVMSPVKEYMLVDQSEDLSVSIGDKIAFESCEELLGSGEGGEKLVELLRRILTIARLLIPIVLIGFSIFDFARAIFSGEDQMKKIQARLIKRLVIAVILFLVPGVLKFILEMAHEIWPTVSPDLCGILD